MSLSPLVFPAGIELRPHESVETASSDSLQCKASYLSIMA